MMTNKHVIITGASAGLGEALAYRLAHLNANLTLTARRTERLEEVKKNLLKINPSIEVLVVPADIADKASVLQMIKKSVEHFSKIDVVIANAGRGMWTRFKDLADPDEIDELMQINFMGMVYSLFYALPELRKSRGSFVAISSIQGLIPIAFHTGYVASKFAMNGFIETIRLEEPDVHFLLALPAWIAKTELRSQALSGVGSDAVTVNKSHGKSAVSADDCAELIISALEKRKRELFIPNKYRPVPLLRLLNKSLFDRMVMDKVKTQLTTHL